MAARCGLIIGGKDTLPTAAEKRLFCRHLFRDNPDSADARHAYLDTLYAQVREALTSGKTLTATSAAGASATFMVFQSFTPAEVAELIDEAHTWADQATLVDALVLIGPNVRAFRNDFSTV